MESMVRPLLMPVLLVLLFATATLGRTPLPSWIHCFSTQDCNPGHCCRISYERYSVPRCEPILKLGEDCRPGEPFITNGTRGFPDGTTIEIEDAYVMFCPCAPGLVCDRAESVCREADVIKDSNHLISHSARRDD